MGEPPDPSGIGGNHADLPDTTLALHPVPPACSLGRGGGFLRNGRPLYAGLLMRAGCHTYPGPTEADPRTTDPTTPWTPPRLSKAQVLLGPPDRSGFADAPVLAAEDAVSFALPLPLSDGGWGVVWGEAVDTGAMTLSGGVWPEWVSTRILWSEFSGGVWAEPRILAQSDLGFALLAPAEHVTVDRAGPAVLIVEPGVVGSVQDSIRSVSLWTPDHGLVQVPFTHESRLQSVIPVLGVDRRGHHWLAWTDQEQGATESPLRFRMRDVGPGGTDPRDPIWVDMDVELGDRLGDVLVRFDGRDRPHLLWQPNSPGSLDFVHGTASEVGDTWRWQTVVGAAATPPPGGVDRIVSGTGPSGRLHAYSLHGNTSASDGNFANVHHWKWVDGSWQHLGILAGAERADTSLLPFWVQGADGAWSNAAIVTGMAVPENWDVPDSYEPDVRLYGHLPGPLNPRR